MQPFMPTRQPEPPAPAPEPAEVDVADEGDPRARLGALVDIVHLDSAGREARRLAQVIGVDEAAGTVRVAYFGEVSHPLPLDHQVHGRADAVRVELRS